MKSIFSYLPKKFLFVLISILAVIGVGVAVQAGFGPDRPTYTIANPADHITFNSITDNQVVGDERQFVTGGINGVSADTLNDPVNNVKNGDEVNILVFVHNDALDTLNLKATNTTVRVALPTGSNKTQTVTGYVSADNATPKEVFDTLDINGINNTAFELSYIPGTATFTNKIFTNGTALPDSVVTTGALVGYDKLDGIVPGCSEFAGWVQLRVKVKMPNYSVEKKARILGETGADKWRETVNAKPGDTIEWTIKFTNIGETELKNVVVLDEVPANLTVVPKSVKLINGYFPESSPFIYGDEAVQADGRQINVEIGDYGPNSWGFVMFQTKVTDASKLVCGDNKFTNEVFATPKGYGAVADKAYLVIDKDCGQPVYRCDLLTLTTVSGRNIKADVNTTATNGASLSTISYDFGDGSQKLVTDKSSVTYTYAKDGTFTVKAVPSFKIGNQTFTATSDNCVKQVTFGTTPTPTPTPPKELPNTGSGSIVGLFFGTSVVSALGYRLWMIRRIGR